MISMTNDPVQDGATCVNCQAPLRSMVVTTNHGKQAVYVCEQESCPRKGNLTTLYRPAAVNKPVAVTSNPQ